MMEELRGRWFKRTGINWQCYTQIFKGVIAATIASAACQTATWVSLLGSLSFIVPVAAVICYPMQPRGQFMRALFLNIAAVCVTAAFTALAMFSVVKARSGMSAYDSSASIVASVWLVVLTFAITVARVKFKSMVWPTAAALIVSNYGLIYSPGFTTIQQAMNFLLQLLYCHLLGFAISFGVSFIVFPTTSRQSFCDVLKQCATSAISTMEANCALRKALTDKNAEALQAKVLDLRRQTSNLATLQMRLVGAETAAAQEIYIRGPSIQELGEASERMRRILTPLIGMDHLADIAERVTLQPEGSEESAHTPAEYLSTSLKRVETPFDRACNISSDGIELAMRHMGLYVDSSAHDENGAHYEDLVIRIQECLELLLESKKSLATPWAQAQDSLLAHSAQKPTLDYQAVRQEMFAVLHGEVLIWTTTQRVLELIKFTKQLRTAFNEKRPWYQLLYSDARHLFRDISQRSLSPVQTASSWISPFHVPTKSTADVPRQNEGLVKSPSNSRFFASSAAGFGLRVAAATTSIAVVAMLRDTHAFFIKQHMIWAVYAVSYAMQASKGQSIRHFFYRFSGTAIGASMAMISFYASNGHPAGELAFYFLFMHFPIYVILQHPRIQTTGTVTAFALIIILGNKLDLQRFGTSKAEQMNLAVQPIWLIALIRLASIGGGLLLATIWTLLPYPISEQDQVRHSAAVCLNLVAKYYTSTYLSTRSRLKSSSKTDGSKGTEQMRQYEEGRDPSRADIDSKLLEINSQLSFTKWDLSIGTHFPRAQYDNIRNAIEATVQSLDTIRLAAIVFVDSVVTPEHLSASAWLRNFRGVFDRAESASQQATTFLIVLASSLNTVTPLPPFLTIPDAYSLSQSLDDLDIDLLNVRNASEPGLATFATIQIEIQRIHKRVGELLKVIKELVGEQDVAVGV